MPKIATLVWVLLLCWIMCFCMSDSWRGRKWLIVRLRFSRSPCVWFLCCLSSRQSCIPEDFTPDLALQKQHWRLEVSAVVSAENPFLMDLECVKIKGLVTGMSIRGCLLSWNMRVVKYGSNMTTSYCEHKKNWHSSWDELSNLTSFLFSLALLFFDSELHSADPAFSDYK